ncbi:hypothetical protein [Lentibacter sp.]|mgnify:CR=1 FL=1|uniref:hypothetical protein n=1 Tax=Lentibacter sp. TaxID=2024994 RepID=UPI003F699BD1
MATTQQKVTRPKFEQILRPRFTPISPSGVSTLSDLDEYIIRKAEIVGARRDRDFGVIEVRIKLKYQTQASGPLMQMNRLIVLDICHAQTAKDRRKRLFRHVFEMARLILRRDKSEFALAA